MQRLPIPPFTRDTAQAKVQAAEDAWNTRDPEKVAEAHSPDCIWRNREESFQGRAAIEHLVKRIWASALQCRLDKEMFLKILCKACQHYKVNVHDYCLMDNHYHLLVETTAENLSLFMRHINSNYAIYFNKRYQRSGHLWQGRFKSWYILNDEYLYTLFRYIEHNPIKAKMAEHVGEYEYTLLATLLNNKLTTPQCAQHSQLKKEIHHEGVLESREI